MLALLPRLLHCVFVAVRCCAVELLRCCAAVLLICCVVVAVVVVHEARQIEDRRSSMQQVRRYIHTHDGTCLLQTPLHKPQARIRQQHRRRHAAVSAYTRALCLVQCIILLKVSIIEIFVLKIRSQWHFCACCCAERRRR